MTAVETCQGGFRVGRSHAAVQRPISPEPPLSPLSSRSERTRIFYFALLATTTYAVFLKENRMMPINATDLDRKS
jgi:hypothetical protein